MIRLDRFLSEMGVGTRTEVKAMIRKGRVSVDGVTQKKPEHKVDEVTAAVSVDGEAVRYQRYRYFMMNKPQGVVSATRDGREKTVLSLIKEKHPEDLFPAGRLDKDTEGLLLITNDGALAHELLSPKKHVDKTYYALIRGCVTRETAAAFSSGMNIGTPEEPEFTMPAGLAVLKSGEESEVRITIREGKYHQIKRMFQVVGMEVQYLKREQMGPLKLDPALLPGEYRELTKEECEALHRREKPTEHEMLRGIEAIIFDLDGTLVDSMWIWDEVDEDFYKKYGLTEPDGFKQEMDGMSYSEVADLFLKTFPSLTMTPEELMDEWNDMAMEKYRTKVPLKAGVKEFLKAQKAAGRSLGIATSNGIELTETVLSSLGVREYFSSVHSACEVDHGKPEPDIFRLVADDLGVDASRCLIFEDIIKGIIAGKRAGMTTCAVYDDSARNQEDEKKELADYWIKDFRELVKV